MTIVNRDAEAFAGGVARQIRAHGRQAEYAEISELRHRILSLFHPRGAIERLSHRAYP